MFLPLKLDLQRLTTVPLTLADLAGDRNVGEKLHLDLVVSLALTRLAPTAFHVERKPAGFVSPGPSLGDSGEQLSDGGKGARVGGRVAAGSPANGRLVDVDHLVDVFDSLDLVEIAGPVLSPEEVLGQLLVEDLVDKGALATARYTGDAHKDAQRDLDLYAFEVVLPSSCHNQFLGVDRPAFLGE